MRRVAWSSQVCVLLKGVVDFAKEIARLRKEQGVAQAYLDKLQKKVSMPDYAAKAPLATQARRCRRATQRRDRFAAAAGPHAHPPRCGASARACAGGGSESLR